MKQIAEFRTPCPLCGANRVREPSKTTPDLRKAARSLAAHLAFVHNIQDGCALVCILGNGLERDNFEALTHWVEEQIRHIRDWPLSSSEVTLLIDDLERSLGHILDRARNYDDLG